MAHLPSLPQPVPAPTYRCPWGMSQSGDGNSSSSAEHPAWGLGCHSPGMGEMGWAGWCPGRVLSPAFTGRQKEKSLGGGGSWQA